MIKQTKDELAAGLIEVARYVTEAEPSKTFDHTCYEAAAALRSMSEEPACGVCCGEGHVLDGGPCICGGIGTEHGEMMGLREALFNLQRSMSEDVKIATEDSVNPHLLTAGRDSKGAFIYPFLDCDELCADKPAGKALIGLIIHPRKDKSNG